LNVPGRGGRAISGALLATWQQKLEFVAHFVAKYLETNCIEDWETKVNAIVF
jgi:hypothetical protein